MKCKDCAEEWRDIKGYEGLYQISTFGRVKSLVGWVGNKYSKKYIKRKLENEVKKKMRIVELFAGIGACSTALKRMGIDIEIVDAVEIDKYAMASFNAIHGTTFEPQDITKWNKELKDIDLITHGSPCQDFSVAGKQAGGDIGSGTRSSLMYETIRIVGQIRPKYVLWENVKNLLSKKHKHNFDAYIETMNILGYNSYYQVLNAKDYGIPQNRERVYTISIRKDIDKGNFVFPEKEELKLRLKDMLEDEVDEKYYLSDKIIGCSGGNRMPKILVKNATKKGYDEAIEGDSINLQFPDSNTRRGRVGHQVSQTLQCNDSMGVVTQHETLKNKLCNELIDKGIVQGGEIINHSYTNSQQRDTLDKYIETTNGITPTLTTRADILGYVDNKNTSLRIRKLTPKECWRLMGFSDENFEKAANIPTSNSQLYKQARKLNLRTSIRKNI